MINDFKEEREKYLKTFKSFGYEENNFIFFSSFEATKNFIIQHLEKGKLHIDLIITNDSEDSGNDILKASELLFFKNSLTTSYSNNNFRISAIPIILYSKNEGKTSTFKTGFNAIIQKKEFGLHEQLIKECEICIKNWRTLLLSDLDSLEIKLDQLPDFKYLPHYINYYQRKFSNDALHHFAIKTKVVSMEFIKCPTKLNYDWLLLKNKEIERVISKYIETYKNHIKYDRKNGERTILHKFFKENVGILLRDTYVDLEYELNLNEADSKESEECDFILKTDYPDFLKTTFFEVKKEDVQFYVKKKTKRPQFSSEFQAHLRQIFGYKEFCEKAENKLELKSKLKYPTEKFDFILLAGRLEEKYEMKHIFESEVNRMFNGIDVITFDELENTNINYLGKFSRLKI